MLAENPEKILPLLEPGMYEVGRGRFYKLTDPFSPSGRPPHLAQRLTVPLDEARRCLEKDSDLACPRLDPPAWRFSHPLESRWSMGLLSMIIAGIMSWVFIPPLRRWVKSHWAQMKRDLGPEHTSKKRDKDCAPDSDDTTTSAPAKSWLNRLLASLPWWIGPGLFLVTLFPALFVWMNTTPEPFVLAAGVSIWPAELLRTAAAVLSAAFIVVAWRTLGASDRAIAEDFQLPTHYCARTFSCGRHALRTGYHNLLARALELVRGTGPIGFRSSTAWSSWRYLSHCYLSACFRKPSCARP